MNQLSQTPNKSMSKEHACDLNKLEKETYILILDSITSQSVYHQESFISKYLKQLTSSSSIQVFYLTFDSIEINDVYEANPNITNLYDFMSKLSLGCIKKVLTQLLSQRLNKSKINVSDIIKNPMVIELEKILSDENLVLRYTGYTKPFQSAYWKIEPQYIEFQILSIMIVLLKICHFKCCALILRARNIYIDIFYQHIQFVTKCIW